MYVQRQGIKIMISTIKRKHLTPIRMQTKTQTEQFSCHQTTSYRLEPNRNNLYVHVDHQLLTHKRLNTMLYDPNSLSGLDVPRTHHLVFFSSKVIIH